MFSSHVCNWDDVVISYDMGVFTPLRLEFTMSDIKKCSNPECYVHDGESCAMGEMSDNLHECKYYNGVKDEDTILKVGEIDSDIFSQELRKEYIDVISNIMQSSPKFDPKTYQASVGELIVDILFHEDFKSMREFAHDNILRMVLDNPYVNPEIRKLALMAAELEKIK